MPVHSPRFPFERFEQWMILLVDVKSNKLVGYQKLSQNTRCEKVQLKFLAPNEARPPPSAARAPARPSPARRPRPPARRFARRFARSPPRPP